MAAPLVTYEIEGPLALIGLNRAEKRNAINNELVEEIRRAVVRAGDEADVGVLYGHGSNFSAGLDLAEAFKRFAPDAPQPKKRKRHAWHEIFDIIQRGPIPFVAAMHGAVVGGGLELATAAHIRVADETAFFGLPEGQRGIFVGGGGSVRIQRVIGYTTMCDLMLTGRLLNAQEARENYIAQYVVPAGQALAKAKELGQRIAQNAYNTNWAVCNMLPRVNDLSHDDGLFMEFMNSSMVRSPESQVRLKAFLEKRATPLNDPNKGE
ncbi:MAG: crotonase/enoyl-CoA hydratase family protein [Xanthobacteraceae bacterium]